MHGERGWCGGVSERGKVVTTKVAGGTRTKFGMFMRTNGVWSPRGGHWGWAWARELGMQWGPTKLGMQWGRALRRDVHRRQATETVANGGLWEPLTRAQHFCNRLAETAGVDMQLWTHTEDVVVFSLMVSCGSALV